MRTQAALAVVLCGLGTTAARAEDEPTTPTFEVFGFAMTDSGYDFGTNDQAWYDVVRPSKLPSARR